MRFAVNVLRGALVLFVLVAFAGTARAQLGYDRPGGNYHSFTVRSGDPAVCASRCEHDSRCRAWSFAFPHSKTALATCWLKGKLPRRVQNDCCVSGVRGASVIAPRRGEIEYFMDRHGGDYTSFATASSPTGEPCKTACEADRRCRSWTYVRPGYNSASARCHLKSKIPRPRHKPCCISGVVR